MPSPDRRYSRKRRRSYGQANRDRRAKALEVLRPVEKETSARLAAALITFFGSDSEHGVVPEVDRINRKHKVKILDPTIVRERFGRGFEAGYNYATAMQAIARECGERATMSVPIEGINIIGLRRKKTIVAMVSGDRLNKERRAVRECLGEAGMRGFQGKGSRADGVVNVELGLSKLHIPTDDEVLDVMRTRNLAEDEVPLSQRQVIDDIESLLSAHGITELNLHAAKVKAH